MLYILLLVAGIIILFSCKKEITCQSCREKNKPPIAVAGVDQLILLPTDSILLDGSRSSDADGKIIEWLWIKISGPVSFKIVSSVSAKTTVTKLAAGIYQFELKVTDDKSLSASDTVQVIVDGVPTSHPPTANAGADTTITLPANTINLDGTRSTDPDNNISSYLWTKISGPSSFSITNHNVVQTQVTNLVEGVYQFELNVTDAGGLFSKDTMQVTVNAQSPPPLPQLCDNNRPQITAQLIPIGALSIPRTTVAMASAGNKILFAGGYTGDITGWQHYSRVDIYDLVNQTWSIAELSVARSNIAAVTSGNKIFFGGGEIGDGTAPVSTVDIYDAFTNTWSATSVTSMPRHGMAAAAVGNRILFAGGDWGFWGTGPWGTSNNVDIYDTTNQTWSGSLLSEPKEVLTAVTANNKVYFAGGETWAGDPSTMPPTFASKKIDIYDYPTNTWSTSTLIEGKVGFASVLVDNKIYWAGGATSSNNSFYPSCAVEIRDINTGNSSVQYLSGNSSSLTSAAVVKDNKIAFFKFSWTGLDDKFDIYDIATGQWSIGVLPIVINRYSVLPVNNTIYIAGAYVNGVLSNQVWKLEF